MTSKRDDSEPKESHGTVELDEGGRLSLPKTLREELQLDVGTMFEVVREGGDVRLVREVVELETVTRGDEWGPEAFRDAGAATFNSNSTDE